MNKSSVVLCPWLCSIPMQAGSHLGGFGEKLSQANQESSEANLQESMQATEDSLLPPVEEVSGNTQTGDSSADGVNESASVALAGANEKQVPNPSVTEYNFLKFKNSFLEAVEELYMRRAVDAENEKRIEELMSKKHELEQKLEEESERCSSIMDEHFQQEQEVRRQCDEQLKTVEIEKHKCNVLNECKEQELKTLKDELRVLHLTKYNLEKKVQEQERQLHLQSASKDSCVSQMNHLENMCLTLSKQVVQLEDNLEMLEHNTKEAVKLNKKLVYVNEHQNCVLSEYKRGVENYKKELIKAKAELGERTAGALSNPLVSSANKLKACEHELRMQVEMGNQLENQLSQLRNEHQGLLKTLKDSNSLLERHTDTIVRLNAEKSETSNELSQTKSKLEDLQKLFGDSTERYETLAKVYKKEKDELTEKLTEVTCRLKVLQNDYTALLGAKDQLEEEKKNLLSKTEDSEGKFHSLMEKYDALVEKTGGQTKAVPSVDSGGVTATGLTCEDGGKESSEGIKNIQSNDQQPHQVENEAENVVVPVEHVSTAESEEIDIDKEDEVQIITVQSPQRNPQHEQQHSTSDISKSSVEVESSTNHKDTVPMSKQPATKVKPSSPIMLLPLQPRHPLHTESPSPELITSSPEAEKNLNEDREAIVHSERDSVVTVAADQPKIVKCCSIRVNRINLVGDESVPSEAVDVIHSSVNVDGELPVKRNIEEVEVLPDNVHTTTESDDEVIEQKVKKIKQETEDNAHKTDGKVVDTEAKEENKQTERDKEVASMDSTSTLCQIKTEAEQEDCATIMFSDDEDEETLLNSQLNRQISKVQDFLKLDRLRRPKKFSLGSGSRC